MKTEIKAYITKSEDMEWKPLNETGVDTHGLFVKTLHYNNHQNRPSSFLLKFEPGAQYPYHNHPAGEELLVLKGSCKIEGELLSQGDYLYTPPNFKHAVASEEGCILFFMVPEEVEIMDRE